MRIENRRVSAEALANNVAGPIHTRQGFVDHGHLRRIVPAVRILDETPFQKWYPHRSPVVTRDGRNVMHAGAAAGRGCEAFRENATGRRTAFCEWQAAGDSGMGNARNRAELIEQPEDEGDPG